MPFQLAAGRKRSAVFAASISPLASLAAPMPAQAVPVQYCHVPCAAVAALPTTTTPASVLAAEPPPTASAASEKR
ncbi:hypothetical protein D3C72_2482170 [compost metagenome]